MEEEEYDSDSTVLLNNYNDKPEKLDAKRRRLSSLHDRHADKYEDENTVPRDPSDNVRTDSLPEKQKNNTDKNLHVIQYLAGLGDVNIKNNKAIDFQIAPAPQNLLNQISGERHFYKGDTLKRATNFVNDDDIICIESDDDNETPIDEIQNEDINNDAVHKVYGDNNNLPENKYGKLTVLKPAAINARRATSNVFEQSEFPSNRNDSVRLDENRQHKVRVLKPSVINTRRATTSFEGNGNAFNKRIVAPKSNIKNKKLLSLELNEKTKETAKDYYITSKNSELPKTSPNSTEEERYNMTGSSDKVQVANTNTTVSVASKTLLNRKMNIFLNENPNKRFSDEEVTPTEPKRFRIETKPKFTKELQLKNVTFDKDKVRKSNESNENEKQNNTHRKLETTEGYVEPGTSLNILNPKTFKTVNKQESSKLQDKQITSEGHYEQEASEAYDMRKINNVQNEQEMCKVRNAEKTIRVHDEQVVNRSCDKLKKIEVDNKQEINALKDQQFILDAHDKQKTCKILEEQIKNKSHNEQQRSEIQDEEISQIRDMQELKNVKGKQIISKPHIEQERSTGQDNEISEVPDMQGTNNVQGKQIISKPHIEQERSTGQDDEISEVPDMQGTNNVQGKQIISKLNNEHERSTVPVDEISQVHDMQKNNNVQGKQIINKPHNEQERSTVPDEISEVYDMQETNNVQRKQEISKSHNEQERITVQDDEIREIHYMQETSKVKDKQISKPHNELKRSMVQDDDISQVHDMQETNNVQGKQIISKLHNEQEKRTVHVDEIEIHGTQDASKVQNKQIISKPQTEQKRSKVQDDEIGQIRDTQELKNVKGKQIISKPHIEQERSTGQDDEISEVPDMQVTNNVQGKQIISKLNNEHERSTVPVDEISQVHDMQKNNNVQGKQIISKLNNEHERSTVPVDEISQVHDMQKNNNVQGKQIINKPHNEQERSTVPGEISEVYDMQETNNVQRKQEISKSHYEQERITVQDDEIREIHYMQETGKVKDKQIISKPHNELKRSMVQDDDISQVHDVQETNNVQGKQIISKLHNEQEKRTVHVDEIEIHGTQDASKVQNKQIISKPQTEQKRSKVQDDEISQAHDMRETIKVQGTPIINKHEGSKIQDDEISQVQETSKVQDKQIISKPQDEQESSKVQDDEISQIRDKQGTRKVQENQRSTEVQYTQEAKNVNDEQKTSETVNELEENITPKVIPDGLKGLLLKFQVQFFRLIKEYIKNDHPESSRSLHHLTRSLVIDAKNGKVHTDIKYSCPQCGHVSTYSANLLNDTDDENIATADDFQKCSLCRGFKKLHSTYMIRYLQEVAVKNETNIPVETSEQDTAAKSQPLCNKKSVAVNLDSNTPVPTDNNNLAGESPAGKYLKENIFDRSMDNVHNETETEMRLCKEISSEKITVSKEDNICAKNKISYIDDKALSKNDLITKKRKNIDAKRNNAQNDKNLTNLSVSPSKDTGSTSTSNFQNDIIENNNKIPAVTATITQGNVKLSDKRPNKVIILSAQNITPRNEFNENERHDSCFKDNNRNIVKETQVNGDTLTNNIMKIVSRKSDDSYLKAAGMSGSNNETELNRTANDESTNENTPDKAANNRQTITTNINVLNSSLKSKSNSMAVTAATTGEKYSEKENKPVTENANKIIESKTSEKMSDDKEIRNLSNKVEENVPSKKTNKPGDNISNNATSERPQTTADSNPDIETNPREKNSTNGNNLKALMDCFTKIKNNINTTGKEVKNAKEEQENNVVSASNVNNSFDKQPKKANVEYICPVCSCEYVHAAKLLSHMRNNHNLNLTTIPKNCVRRKCVFCNEQNIINYNTHVKKYHREKFTVGKNESNNIKQGDNVTNKNERPLLNSNNRTNETTISSKYKYHCSICDEILTSCYACRQHRKQYHPDFKNQPIYKKVIIEDKEKIHHGDVNTNLDDNEDSSDDDDNSLCTDNGHVTSDQENESDGNELEETYNNNMKCTKYVYLCKLCKATFSSYNVSRKHRMEKHPHMSGTHLIKRIPNDDTSNGRNSERKENEQLSRNDNLSSGDDDGEIGDNIDTNSLRSYHEKEVNSDEEAIKASGHTHKKKTERTTELDDNDNNASAQTKIKEKKSNQEAIRKQSNDKLLTRNRDDVLSERILDKDFKNCNENDPTVLDEEKHAGDDKNTKISKHAVTKMKECLTKLFDDKDKNAEPDIINKNYDQQHTEIEKTNAESASNYSEGEVASVEDRVNVSEHTVKRKKERITKCFGNDDNDAIIQVSETERDQEVRTSTTNASNLKPTDDESITKVVEISEKNVETEYSNEDCENEMNYQESTTEKCDKKIDGDGDMTVSSKVPANGNNKIDILTNAESKVHDNDQTEIDMIDCLLEELNREPPASLGNDICGVNNSEIQDTDANHTTNMSVEVKTSLENIKITNVISIADKLYIYICQECHYATDDYDTVIRHCQNHYNEIEDPVTYCQTCQIKYHTACFKRHEISHVRYLNSAKINFSYKLLFTNWQAVFENMLLRDAEDIQVKSIYKTFCVKMVVREDGPWQTSLYLCSKCNTCVPHQDIEKHVQQKCCFMNFPCSMCYCAFVTNDMRKHHEIYHKADKSKLFKIIVFNDNLDESFNLKLFQAKALLQNREKQGVSDIFKCLCGLCFVSLKNFKLHFVECEEQANNGIDCPDCTVLRRFLPTEIDDHLSLHHGTQKYDFRVQQIAFQEETNHNNSSAVINSPDTETENGSLAEIEDLRDTLKGRHEIATQTTNDDSQNDPEANQLNEEDLAVERDILKDETLTQNTNDNNSQRDPESVELNQEDIAIKRDMLKDESLTQNTNDNNSQRDPEASEFNEEDLAVERDILKDETLTQTTNDNDSQRDTESVEVNEEDIAIKRDMLKDESLTQNTNDNNSQRDPEASEFNEEDLAVERDILKDETLTQTTNDNDSQRDTESVEVNEEDIAIKRDMLKDESLTQNTNDNNSQSNPKFAEPNDNEDLAVIGKLSSQEIMDVDEYEPAIPIDDSDSDIEFIE